MNLTGGPLNKLAEANVADLGGFTLARVVDDVPMITTPREATAAMGSGFDDFLAPGDSPEEVTVYLVECPIGHFSYYSPDWIRGGVCPKCGRRLRVSESSEPPPQEDALHEVLADLPKSYWAPAREVLSALKSGAEKATHELQKDLGLSSVIFGAVVTHLVNHGLLDIQGENTSEEGLRLTTHGKRVLEKASLT